MEQSIEYGTISLPSVDGEEAMRKSPYPDGEGLVSTDSLPDGEKSTMASSLPDEAKATLADALPDEEMLYDLADLFKVFADTTRIKILYALMDGERCVADIAALVGATQSTVSHQLRILKQARLVKFQREGKNIFYALSDDHVYTMLSQGMTHICE